MGSNPICVSALHFSRLEYGEGVLGLSFYLMYLITDDDWAGLSHANGLSGTMVVDAYHSFYSGPSRTDYLGSNE
jgi:hypothetical protein